LYFFKAALAPGVRPKVADPVRRREDRATRACLFWQRRQPQLLEVADPLLPEVPPN
jgi:hypothetical protein